MRLRKLSGQRFLRYWLNYILNAALAETARGQQQTWVFHSVTPSHPAKHHLVSVQSKWLREVSRCFQNCRWNSKTLKHNFLFCVLHIFAPPHWVYAYQREKLSVSYVYFCNGSWNCDTTFVDLIWVTLWENTEQKLFVYRRKTNFLMGQSKEKSRCA